MPPTDDPISGAPRNASYRPAFPRWLRSIDPVLALEDHNSLFQSLRVLRARRSLLARLGRPPGLGGVGLLRAATLGALLVGTFLLRFLGQEGLPVLLAGAAILHWLANRWESRAQPAAGRFPLRPSNLVHPSGGCHAQALQDLWLSGVKGSQIAIAWYLDAALSLWHVTRLASPFALTLLAVILTPLLSKLPAPAQVEGLSLIVFVAGIGPCVLFLALEGLRSQARDMVRHWRTRGGIILHGREKLVDAGLQRFFALALLLVLALWTGDYLGRVLHHLQNPMQLARFGGFGADLAPILSFFAAGFAIIVVFLRREPDYLGVELLAFAEADGGLEAYVVTVLNGDAVDGAKWAHKRYSPLIRAQYLERWREVGRRW